MKIELLNGDCLDVMEWIDEKSIDLVLTDPPYGTTQNKWDSILSFDKVWHLVKIISKENTPIVIFGAEPFSSTLRLSNLDMYKHDWYWKKENGTGFLNAKKYPLYCIEIASVFCLKTPTYYPQKTKGKPYTQKSGRATENYGSQVQVQTVNNGDRYPLNFLEFKRDKNKVHPTQKPVALLEYLIKTYTKEGDTVLDFTMGSGSTGVACVNTNRNFIGIEKDEKYFQIAKRRIEEAQKAKQ